MALQVWLPLTQDLRQQGVNGTNVEEVTSAVFDNNGKLGKCLSGGKIKIPASKVASIFNNTSMSIAFWYNNNTSETTGNHAICGFSGNTEGDTDAVRIWDFFNYANPNTFHWSMGTLGGGSLADIFPANTWVHVCVTWNAPTLKIYMDGVLKYTGSGSSNYTFDKSYYISFGRTPQKLNDFRIYNNCLTPEEVKKIAQGLVLHYPLNHEGLGNANLITNSKLDESWTYPSSSYSDKYSPITTIIPSASQYTLSFDAKSTVNGDKIRTHYYSPNTTTTCVSNQGTTKTAADGNMDFTLTTQWQRYWVTYTQTETTAVKHLICPRLVSGQGTGTISVRNVKFEEGAIATPWCPNLSDAGSNATVEYDCSGFCNNGTRIGNITWTTDTPKYSVSTYCVAGTGIFGHPNITLSQYTIAFWGKHTATGKMLMGSNASTTTTNGNWYWYGDNSFKYPGGEFYYSHNAGTAQELLNKWTHFVAVYDGSNITIYRNGINEGSQAVTGTQLLEYISIGNGYPASSRWEDNWVSDLRIYATALSAEDIQALYQAKNIPN